MTRFGRTPAKDVAAEIVELCSNLHAGELVKLERFLPVYVRHSVAQSADLRPEWSHDRDFGEVSPRELQRARNRVSRYDTPGKHAPGFRFKYDLHEAPHIRVHVLPKAVYGIRVLLGSENAKPEETLLKITQSGEWRDSARATFEEIVFEQAGPFP
jgi:hypothetical protein